tara:strand:+ start:5578 stop:5856 length:279 start_codon:yes stop_codon:yes gene_type:complete
MDASNKSISADFDGQVMNIPVDPANRHYAEIVEQGIEIAPYVEPEPSWIDSRIAAYGSAGSQLDMQYWDGVNGTTVWPDHITKVKADHPKPT